MPIQDRQSAIVHSVKEDKAKAGRIKVKVATTDGAVYPHELEPVFLPGWFSPPHPGDTVEIELPEDEDIVEHSDEACYLGVRLDDKNPPPQEFRTNYPDRRGYKTPGGHLLLFDDKEKTITIKTQGGLDVKLDDGAGTVQLGQAGASESLVLGDTFVGDLTTYLSTIDTAILTFIGAAPQGLADVIAFILALGTANATFNAASGGWKSSTVKTV